MISGSHSEIPRKQIGSAAETNCETWAATCTLRCAPIHPSSQNACHQKNPRNIPDKTETVRIRGTGRILWKSTPTHYREVHQPRRRFGSQETRLPARDSSSQSRNYRISPSALLHPRDKFAHLQLERHMRRAAIRLRWVATSLPSGRRLSPPPDSHRPANPAATVCLRTWCDRSSNLPHASKTPDA